MDPKEGQALRDRRMSMKVPLEKVADQTGVPPHFLDALERGEYGVIPPGPYVKVYLKAYKACLDRLGSERQGEPSLERPRSSPGSTSGATVPLVVKTRPLPETLTESEGEEGQARPSRWLHNAGVGALVAIALVMIATEFSTLWTRYLAKGQEVGWPVKVQIMTQRPVRYRVWADGQALVDGSFLEGHRQVYAGREKVEIIVSDISAINVRFGDRGVPRSGKAGSQRLVFVNEQSGR